MSAKIWRCDACLKESEDGTGWIWFNFKHLSPVWLCPGCQREWKEHMTKLQGAGA